MPLSFLRLGLSLLLLRNAGSIFLSIKRYIAVVDRYMRCGLE